MTSPTDGEITTAIRLILRDANLDSLTAKGVRKQLEEQFNVSLASKKNFVNDEIRAILEEQHNGDAGGNEDEEDAPDFSGYDDSEEDAAASSKKRKVATSKANPSAKKAKKAVTPKKGAKSKTKATVKSKTAKGKAKASAKTKGKAKASTKAKAKKVKKKINRTGAMPGGLSAPQPVSKELAEFLNGQTEIARAHVVKALWDYIKAKNLQNPENKTEIFCDQKMQKLFGETKMTMFKMNSLISKHFIKPEGYQPKVKAAPKPPGERTGGLQRPHPVTEQLSAFLGGEKEIARAQVVKKLWEYIKAKNLQNPENKQEIICDSTLASLLGQDRVSMFTMNKLISRHFVKVEK